jgi:hypothetical protein
MIVIVISEIFSPKVLETNRALLTKNAAYIFIPKIDHSIGFQDKRHFSPKIGKNAESSDHNIGP